MTQQPHNPDQIPLFPPPPPRRSPEAIAAVLGLYVRSLLVVLFWLVVGTAGVSLSYVSIRAILFGIGLVTKAVGI